MVSDNRHVHCRISTATSSSRSISRKYTVVSHQSRSEVLTTKLIKSEVFWGCRLLKVTDVACCFLLLVLCNLRSITVTSNIVGTCIISLSAFIFRVRDEGLTNYKSQQIHLQEQTHGVCL